MCVLGLMLLTVPVFSTELFAQPQDSSRQGDLFEMTLEELMEVPVAESGSLTKTTRRKTPATITVITQEDIQASGARYLDEVLDIYVPNYQWIRNPFEFQNAGLRGVISNRDDKYLLLVNGRVMNEKTHYGAFSERDLPMLRDIHHIDVVRGPGSALYGPGAISMVINIVTENAMSFQGTEFTSRLGAVEEFYSWELKHGKKFSDDSGLYVYVGVSDYLGADTGDAPYITGYKYITDADLDYIEEWEEMDEGELESELSESEYAYNRPGTQLHPSTLRDNQAYQDKLKYKFFGQYTKEDFDLWVRYTRGGVTGSSDTNLLFWGYQPNSTQSSSGYQQFTIHASNKYEITPELSIDYTFSYDMFDYEQIRYYWFELDNAWLPFNAAHSEYEYLAKILANWKPNDSHTVALGIEWSHEAFGRRSPGYPHTKATDTEFLDNWAEEDPPYNIEGLMPRWSTDLSSIVGEHQWNINEQLTTFIGGRIDWHTYTPSMFSPRAVVVYTPSEKDTIKASFSRSVRVPQASAVKFRKLTSGNNTDPERINAFELRYERQHTKELWFGGSLFSQYQKVVEPAFGAEQAGKLRTWGAELEAVYKTEKLRLGLSHGFTKLYSFSGNSYFGELISPTIIDRADLDWTDPDTQDFGNFGHDLAAWSDHITKITGQYKFDDDWTLDGSLRIYWHFTGQEDYARFRVLDLWAYSMVYWDETYQRVFGPSMYLNLGLQYKPNENLTVRLDGYNLLGLLDTDLNKRLIGFNDESPADSQAHAPALGISLTYRF